METVKLTKKICFIITDAISFNILCRGQFEYFKESSDFDMTFIAGGEKQSFSKLLKRKVGNVFDAKLVRKPSVIKDIKSLIILISYLSTNRFDLVVYSTPKALLLGSIATTVTRHNNSIAIVRGRAYENYSGTKRAIYQILDKLSLLSSNKIIFISESLRDAYLCEKLTSRNKSYLLGSGSSNGVDTSRFRPETSTNKDSFTVLVAGRICMDKGIHDLAEVIRRISNKNIVFQLIGSIEDTASEELLYSLISEYPNVEHTPSTNNIENYFKQADLHLFLTHREGFGNVAIEAASCGIPTFAYDVIGVKDSVKEGISGKKFPFKDFKSIANAIDEAASDKGFNKKYPHARDWAIQNFDQKLVWENYLNFYLENIK